MDRHHRSSSQEPHASLALSSARGTIYDSVIVGGGLCGSIAAVALARAGHKVALVDRHAVYPAEFRVEKIAGEQVGMLQQLGLLEPIAAASSAFDKVANAEHGRVVNYTHQQHYGILYADLVREMRAQLPASAEFIVARAVDVRTGPELQELLLAGGETLRTRLVILASGIADVLRHRLDIPRLTHSEGQCITFGFDVVPATDTQFPGGPLTYYGERIEDGIDYLSLFPVNGASGKDTLRANLFVFLDPRHEWLRDFRRMPKDVLTRTVPGLTRVLGDFEVSGPVQHWVTNLYVAQQVERHGVVLIGDAFQTSCPAAGTGVSRLLVDVDRLCNHHLPGWLQTPGMGAGKIAAFYADPVKQNADRHAGELAAYRRALTIERTPKWALQRTKVRLRRHIMGVIDAVRPEWAAALQARRRPGFSLAGKGTP